MLSLPLSLSIFLRGRASLSRKAFSTSLARSSKIYPSAAEAVKVVKSGDILLSGGFGLCGLPNTLLNALGERKGAVTGLTAVSNNVGLGVGPVGLGVLLENGQLSKIIASHIGG